MRKTYIYLTFIVMAVLGTASCSKHSSMDMPDGKEAQENKIGFGSVNPKRADQLDPGSNPLKIRVYDYYTAETASEGTEYINDLIQESTDPNVWVFVEEGKKNSYSWKKGTHKFFGWVAVDESGEGVPDLNYTDTDKVLTIIGENIAPVALPGKDNTDYRYAEVKKVSYPDEVKFVTDDDGKKTGVEPIQLKVNHLSAALSYTVENFTDQTYTINSISVGNVVTTAAPTVDFSGDEAAIAYNLGTTKGSVSLVLGEGDNAKKTCVWPQKIEGSKLTVEYTLGNAAKTTVTVDIPDREWVAGQCYNFNIQIVNKGIELTFTVAPWEQVSKKLDTKDDSINMSNVTWMNTKFDLNGNGIFGERITETYVDPEDGKSKTRILLDENTVQILSYTVMMFPTTGSYQHPIYDTYEEDVEDEAGEVIHKAGEIKVYEKDVTDPVSGEVLHHAGDPVVKEMQTIPYSYQPAQGYFTVNYPVSGLYKIGLIPAYGESTVDPSQYQIKIYDSSSKSWRDLNENGETITHDTVYFRVFATEPRTSTAQQKAQIDIWFKTGSEEWISAYSEIRANYALTIPASN